jgi:hypothetical protein
VTKTMKVSIGIRPFALPPWSPSYNKSYVGEPEGKEKAHDDVRQGYRRTRTTSSGSRQSKSKHGHSHYIEKQKRTYPGNPDKDGYLESLERLRHVMILSKLGYGSREMNMARVNSSRRYPEAYEAFEKELE